MILLSERIDQWVKDDWAWNTMRDYVTADPRDAVLAEVGLLVWFDEIFVKHVCCVRLEGHVQSEPLRGAGCPPPRENQPNRRIRSR